MNNKKAKIGVLLMIALGVALFFIFDLQRFLTLDAIKASQHDFERLYRDHTAASITAYMIIYILVTAMSPPGTIVYLNAETQLGKLDSAAGILSHKINCIYRCKQGRKNGNLLQPGRPREIRGNW